MIESRLSNARYTLGDVDGGEAAAITESTTSNARYTLRDGEFCYKFSVQI